MKRFGEAASGPGAVFLCGGTSAVQIGWRQSTNDADLHLDPEPPGLLASLPRIKEELGLNIELAAPSDFVPVRDDWRDRSPFIRRHGSIDFFHYDFYSQALAKLERSHRQDTRDIEEMISRGLIDTAEFKRMVESIEPRLIRFPAIDPPSLRRKLRRLLERGTTDG